MTDCHRREWFRGTARRHPGRAGPAGVAVFGGRGQRKNARLNEFEMRVRTEVTVVFPELVFVTVETTALLQLPVCVWMVTGMNTPTPSRLARGRKVGARERPTTRWNK